MGKHVAIYLMHHAQVMKEAMTATDVCMDLFKADIALGNHPHKSGAGIMYATLKAAADRCEEAAEALRIFADCLQAKNDLPDAVKKKLATTARDESHGAILGLLNADLVAHSIKDFHERKKETVK